MTYASSESDSPNKQIYVQTKGNKTHMMRNRGLQYLWVLEIVKECLKSWTIMWRVFVILFY